jgi:selenide, water dikinase
MDSLKKTVAGMSIPELLIGIEDGDDAAVYKMTDQKAIILTTDFFTPVVDDPYLYGAIAAANSMSDVFAMGGEVLVALNVAGFPETISEDVVSEIFRGGAEKVREAGGVIAGGHTIDSKEPFYGMSVCGVVHPGQILTKTAAKPGDVLFISKPLGSGIIATAFKGDQCKPEHLDAAIESMTALNNRSARAALNTGCRAATDVTGFSLLGHAFEIAAKSNVSIEFSINAIPFLPGAEYYAEQWLFPAGTNRNEKAYDRHLTFNGQVSQEKRMLLLTPETSGGLLIAVPEKMVDVFKRNCRFQKQAVYGIGTVLEGVPQIIVTV